MSLHEHKAPFNNFHFDVGDGHALYVEQYGNPQGMPAIFLHGGPGSGCTPKHAKIFDPEKFNVVLLDQRGCGKSTPYASVEGNTIVNLWNDIERLRLHLNFDKIALVGGSWGSALAMIYTRNKPENVSRLLLRGVFFADAVGAQWIAEETENRKHAPEYFDAYRDHIPVAERSHGLIKAYNRILAKGPDDPAAIEAHRLFYLWDTAIGHPIPNETVLQAIRDNPKDGFPLSRFFMNFCEHEFSPENKSFILGGREQLKDIPITIAHGLYDWICPHANALELAAAYPHAELVSVEGGHVMGDPAIATALKNVLDGWKP
ncbi:MAG: alpha/beta fold hydrolase [Alphaproteobacteria bacterium]|nr:alpha/beta fold hydrolase [Alphaproteobacteria bacterium]